MGGNKIKKIEIKGKGSIKGLAFFLKKWIFNIYIYIYIYIYNIRQKSKKFLGEKFNFKHIKILIIFQNKGFLQLLRAISIFARVYRFPMNGIQISYERYTDFL